MKREIKFRAWGACCECCKPQMFYQDRSYDDGVFFVDATDDSGRGTIVWDNEVSYGAALMQYTGLRDCAGTDIYEEDIVEYQSATTGKTEREVVEWFVGEDPDGHPASWFMLPYEDVVVVGNRYEDPELYKEVRG